MTSAISKLALEPLTAPRFAVGAAVIMIATVLAVVAGLVGKFPAVPRGWLVGFAVWSCVPIGSMTLLLIHRLTGGPWGVAAAPVLRQAAAMMAQVALAFVPVIATLSRVYPWAA